MVRRLLLVFVALLLLREVAGGAFWIVVGVVAGIFAAAVLALLVWVTLRRRRLSAPSHFLAIARACEPLRAAALAHAADASRGSSFAENDGRIFASPGRVTIVYTVHAGEQVLHHLSAVVEDSTGLPIGTTFALWVAMVLRWPLERVRFRVARSTVHVAEIALTAEEHERLSASPWLEVTRANVMALRRECLEARARIAEVSKRDDRPWADGSPRANRDLFSSEHFIMLAQACASARWHALACADPDHPEDHPSHPPGEDPRDIGTWEGLGATYIANLWRGQAHHTLTVFRNEGETPREVGATFVVWLAMVARWPIDRVRIVVDDSTKHRCTLTLDRAEHELLAALLPLEVTEANVEELRRLCAERVATTPVDRAPERAVSAPVVQGRA